MVKSSNYTLSDTRFNGTFIRDSSCYIFNGTSKAEQSTNGKWEYIPGNTSNGYTSGGTFYKSNNWLDIEVKLDGNKFMTRIWNGTPSYRTEYYSFDDEGNLYLSSFEDSKGIKYTKK
jgi:hypothetical protein